MHASKSTNTVPRIKEELAARSFQEDIYIYIYIGKIKAMLVMHVYMHFPMMSAALPSTDQKENE